MIHEQKDTSRIIILSLLPAVPVSSVREIPMVKKNPVPEGRAPDDPVECRGESGHGTSQAVVTRVPEDLCSDIDCDYGGR